MNCKELMNHIELLAPLSFQEEWDNVGLLIGNKEKEIQRILIAVDPTEAVILQAISQKIDLLITHHPLMLKGQKRFLEEDAMGRKIKQCLVHDINYYALHTNFDVSMMSQLAAKKMDLLQQENLNGSGIVGNLKNEITLEQCGIWLKQLFELDTVRIYGKKEWLIKRCAILPGSGADHIKHAKYAKAELFITGDLKHHQGLDAMEDGMALIDCGHYGLEKIFVPFMEEFLNTIDNSFHIIQGIEQAPFFTL